MFEVGIVTQFEAAHRLHGDFGPAARTHGHTYRVELSVRGERLAANGTLFDITRLQQAADDILQDIHYRDLDEVSLFEGRNTTAEVVAEVLWQAIAPQLDGLGLTSLQVRVWESPHAWAGYDAALDEL